MSRTAVEIEREYGPFAEHDQAHGVTFDGEQVWVATGNRLQAFEPESGKPTRALEVPCEAGLAFDGTHFHQLAGGRIHRIERATGRVVGTIPAPSKQNSGLAWAEGSLWVGSGSGNTIVQVDPKSGEILSTVTSDRFVTGVSFVEGELWHATHRTAEHDQSVLRRVDRKTSEVLEQLNLPAGIGCSGLESDGKERFFCGGGPTGKVRVVKRPAGGRQRAK